jgi:hypothetical protein
MRAGAAIPLETNIQQAFIQWVHLAERTIPALKLLFAVPNGGKRSITTAVTLKKEGARAGVPDTMLPVPRKGFSGLAIEFKRPGGTTSDDQVDYINRLLEEGWQVAICTDAEAAIQTVKDYLAQPKEK